MRISDWSSDVCSSDLEAVAYRELRDGWTQLAIPFHQALWTLEGDRPPLGVSVLTELQQGNRLAQANEIEYGSAPPLDLYQSWGMALCQPTHGGLAKLKATIASYQEAIAPEILDLVRELAAAPMMRNFRRVEPCGTLKPARELGRAS